MCVFHHQTVTRISCLFSFMLIFHLSWCLYMTILIVDNNSDLDILFSSENGHIIYMNKTNYIESASCSSVQNCSDLMIQAAKRAKNIVTFSSTFNFNTTPTSSIKHFMTNDYYMVIVMLTVDIVVSITVFVVTIKPEDRR